MRIFDMRRKQVDWRRSSGCAAGECAEVGLRDGKVLVRSTLAPRAVVEFTPEEFGALRRAFQNHEFDDLA
jgi:Domain of unknown function (DUF397)